MVEEVYDGPSLDPEDSISGGLFDDKTCTWADVKFEMYDYNGKSDPAPVLSVTLLVDGDDPYTQKYSVGQAKFWAPTADGKWITPLTETEKQIRKSSNLHYVMMSLKQAGLPWSMMAAKDVTALNGLVAHMRRKEISGREDFQAQNTTQKRRGADGKEYERDNKVLLVENIVSLPGEKKTAGDAPKPAAKGGKKAASKKAEEAPAAVAKAAPSGDAASKAKDFITKQVMAGGGKVEKKSLPDAAFQVLATDPDRNAVLSIIFNNETILGLGGFAIDNNGVITLG